MSESNPPIPGPQPPGEPPKPPAPEGTPPVVPIAPPEASSIASAPAPAPAAGVPSPPPTATQVHRSSADPGPAIPHARGEMGEAEREIRRLSRRSFVWAFVASAGVFTGWKWLITRRMEDGLPWPFRRALEIDGELSQDFYSNSRLAPTDFASSAVGTPRANGDYGCAADDGFDPKEWKLQVFGLANPLNHDGTPASDGSGSQDSSGADAGNNSSDSSSSNSFGDSESTDKKSADKKQAGDKKSSADASAASSGDSGGSSDSDSSGSSDSSDTSSDSGEQPDAELTMADIMKLPRHTMTTELKCIEGWSQVVEWTGVRFSDFAAKYKPSKDDSGNFLPYVSIETPDGGYYVGLDVESAMHPQTLLCYAMNGKPLTLDHGAPLRLVIPVKYGIKNIKRIGTIRFTDKRPADFWGEQGYDWYSGH